MAAQGPQDLTADAVALLKDLRRAFWLPPPQPEKVRRVLNRIAGLYQESLDLQKCAAARSTRSSPRPRQRVARRRLEGFNARDAADSCAPFVCLLTMVRNRDLLLNYVRHRMLRIEQAPPPAARRPPRTEPSNGLQMTARTHSYRLAQARWEVAGPLPDDSRQLLTPHEQRYETRYNELLSEFQTQYGLDLTRDSTPPSDNLIKARPPAGARTARAAPRPCAASHPDPPTRRRRCMCSRTWANSSGPRAARQSS